MNRSIHVTAILLALAGLITTLAHASAGGRPRALKILRGLPAQTRLAVRPEEEARLEAFARRWQATEASLSSLRAGSPAAKVEQGPRANRGSSARIVVPAENAPPYSPADPETIHVACLRIDFKRDSAATKTTGTGRFDLQRDTTSLVDPAPHDRAYFEAHMAALARYYRAQSYGAMNIQYDVYPSDDTAAFHLRDLADYGPWTLTQRVVQQARRLIHDSFAQADSGRDAIPWDRYDRVILFHAGADFQSDVTQDSPFDIPTFTFNDTAAVAVTHDRTTGRTVSWLGASIIPETEAQDGFIGGINGGLFHEFGLLLYSYCGRTDSPPRSGVPDLYNIYSGLPVLGQWSIMDSGNNIGVTIVGARDTVFAIGVLPGPHDIWSKLQLFPPGTFVKSLSNPSEPLLRGEFCLTADTTFALADIENNPEYAYVQLTQDEYLLLENRETDPDSALGSLELQTDPATGVVLGTARVKVVGLDTTVTQTNEYDALQPASGLLCLHVDNSVLDELCGINATYANTNLRRPGVAIIQADGSKSLGDPGSPFMDGGPFDPFFLGNLSNALYEDGRPNSRANSGGLTHISFETPDAPGNSMRLQLHRSRAMGGWPVLDGPPDPQVFCLDFPAGAAASADLGGDGEAEYFTVGSSVDLSQGFGLPFREVSYVFGHRANGDPVISGGGLPVFLEHGPAIEPELLGMPGWAGGAKDALIGEWVDTSQVGAPVQLFAIGDQGVQLPGFPARSASLTTPLARCREWAAAGAADGRIWLFDHTGFSVAIGDSIGIPVTGRIAIGPLSSDSTWCAAAAYPDGHIRIYRVPPGSTTGAPSARGDGSPLIALLTLHPPSGRITRPVLLAAALPSSDALTGPAKASGTVLFVVDSSGWVDALRTDGAGMVGFPFMLPQPVAGAPTLGDLSGDGRPAILLQTADSRLYAVGMDGRPLPGYPVDLPQGRASAPGAAPLEFRDPAGHPVVLVAASSGDLMGFDSHGRLLPKEYPKAVAAAWGTGIFWVPASVGSASPRMLQLGSDGGWLLDSIPGLRYDDLVSYGPGVDEGRSGFLPAARIAPARDTTSYATLGNLRVYPNPLRIVVQGELRVSFDLPRSSPVRVRLYDLRGQVVAEKNWQGHPAGNVVGVPAARLGSGLYQCEVVVGGSSARRVTPVAIVQ